MSHKFFVKRSTTELMEIKIARLLERAGIEYTVALGLLMAAKFGKHQAATDKVWSQYIRRRADKKATKAFNKAVALLNK